MRAAACVVCVGVYRGELDDIIVGREITQKLRAALLCVQHITQARGHNKESIARVMRFFVAAVGFVIAAQYCSNLHLAGARLFAGFLFYFYFCCFCISGKEEIVM